MEIFGVYLVNQSSGVTIPLHMDQENFIGRGIPDPVKVEKGKVLLAHPSISKTHAKISLAPETHQWILYDNSRHGIHVNGKKVIKEIRLQHGDKIQVGPFVLMFYEKFKADDETSEQPLPVLVAPRSKGSITLNFLVALLLEGVLLLTFPKILVMLSASLIIFASILIVRPTWKKKCHIGYVGLISSLLLGLLGLGIIYIQWRYR